MCHRHGIGTLFLLGALFVPCAGLPADVIKLRNGGEVRGKISRDISIKTADPLIIETLSGSVLAIERKHIKFATRRLLRYEEYETRARRTAATVTAQWELAEWCRAKSMKAEREKHLRRIIDLEPDHLVARKILGYTKTDGKWSTHDERQRARGLVKYRSRYITPEELALTEKSNAETARVREWNKKIKRWHAWMTYRLPSRRKEGTEKLLAIRDPDAVVGLSRYFRDDKNSRMRLFYLRRLADIPGPNPIGPLVWQSLNDQNQELRYASLNTIPKSQYPTAMSMFARALRNSYNVIVQRAALGMARVGDERAIPALIEALVTTHRYRIRIPDRSGTTTFGTNGSTGAGANQNVIPPQVEAMMRAGLLPNGVIINPPIGLKKPKRTKVITVSRSHQNSEVLTALRKITGQSFNYNKRDWRLWVASAKSGNSPLVKSP
jgi:hypothetical protein